jgi:hypothetical protein
MNVIDRSRRSGMIEANQNTEQRPRAGQVQPRGDKILIIRLVYGAALLAALAGCVSTSATPTRPTSLPQPATMVVATTAPQLTAEPPQPTTAAAATQAPAGAIDTTAAVQVVLDYYDAIVQKQYDAAYGLWAQNGAATGQTRAEFEQGYAGTASLSVLLNLPTVSGDTVTVPITILSVLNSSNQTQQPQRFEGIYTLHQEAGGWRIASADIDESDASAEPPASIGDALRVLQAYYQAIDAGNYPRAYTYWENNGTASQQSYTVFVEGFASTTRVTLATGQAQTNAAAGSAYTEVPVVVVAQQRDGSRQSFCGTYRLRRANVPPFDTLGWRINSASILKLEQTDLDSDTIERLLAGQCAAR